jgi:hypothetical protein
MVLRSANADERTGRAQPCDKGPRPLEAVHDRDAGPPEIR